MDVCISSINYSMRTGSTFEAGEGAKNREETAREEIVDEGKSRAPPLLLPAL